MTTVNISLPTSLYEDAKKMLARYGYASISELVRGAIREKIYKEFTENGFTSEFEDEVLRSAAEPRKKNRVWKTEKDIKRYFTQIRKRIKTNGKN